MVEGIDEMVLWGYIVVGEVVAQVGVEGATTDRHKPSSELCACSSW